jgi:uncharacterized cupredoxin-like copper-binding protein
MRAPWLLPVGLAFLVAGSAILAFGLAVGASPGPGVIAVPQAYGLGPMMSGYGYGVPAWGGPLVADGPGSAGLVAGTADAPRVVRVFATGQLRFVPDTVVVKTGETITFEVTAVGMLVHEFMVGPAAEVATDAPGTPEIADIGMMETKSLTYTFSGPGPFAFACHVKGHYEAGMSGAIVVVP